MSRHGAVWTVAITAAFLAAALVFDVGYAGAGGWVAFWRIKLPRSHDARVIGNWEGTWHLTDNPQIRSRVTTFHANGRGYWKEDDLMRATFDWGTEDGVLYTRRMATDAWSGRSHAYSLSADGKSIHFSGVREFDQVSDEMKRQ